MSTIVNQRVSAPLVVRRSNSGPTSTICRPVSQPRLQCQAYYNTSHAKFAESYEIKLPPEMAKFTPDAPASVPGASQAFMQTFAAPAGSDPHQAGLEARRLIDGELHSRGAMLFQGLPITSPELCSEFVEAMGYQRAPYEPFGKGRDKVGKTLDAATTIPSQMVLSVHNEMSYNPRPVNKIMLLCIEPAQQGGENLVAKNQDVVDYLAQHTDVLEDFEKKGGIRYKRSYRAADKMETSEGLHLSWQQRCGTDDPEAAMQFWRDIGFTEVSMDAEGTLEFWRNIGFTEVSMDAEGTLVVCNTESAQRPAPDGSRPFFNNANLAALMPGKPGDLFAVTYGSGEQISPETVQAINKATWSASCALPLAAGSALVLDNFAVMHGRLPYEGGNRTMVALLTAD